MDAVEEVLVAPAPLSRFVPILGAERVQQGLDAAHALQRRAANRTVWNINSTRAGGGVAEMLRSLIAYARGMGIDGRWLVIHGDSEFFRVTKRLHNALHGEEGDGSPLGLAEREIYEATLARNAGSLLARIHGNDVVLLHDPQTAGLAPLLLRAGARVIWRCHVGTDRQNEQTQLGWSFLLPYLRDVRSAVFSRAPFVPPPLDPARVSIITPSIDPFSSKNYDMAPGQPEALLACGGLIQGETRCPASYRRDDGSEAVLEHCADIVRLGPPPNAETPLVVQVSRWDDLKDPLGVMLGFTRMIGRGLPDEVQLVLAGPTVRGVADDPDGPRVFNAVLAQYRSLPHGVRRRVHLVNLPMSDVEENGALVNALQSHAAVVVQKSLREGFGLTVTEAMWKGRPVIASAVGGIQEQIDDGVNGLLLRDPTDLDAFGATLVRVLQAPELARKLGENARARVVERFLGVRHLLQYAQIIERLDDEAAESVAAQP